jgi:hypothetical protein
MVRSGSIRIAYQIRNANGSAPNDKLSLYSTNVLLRMILIFKIVQMYYSPKNSTNVLIRQQPGLIRQQPGLDTTTAFPYTTTASSQNNYLYLLISE